MLRVARFRGTARTDEFLDNRQFHGNALTLLGSAERFFRESLPIAGRIEPDRFERVDDPLYPPSALRVRHLRMPSATGTTPSAEDPWPPRFTTTALK